ncbi:uncharacterized protein LOC106662107 [Cimex lectularius]|uniref:Chitin-binding type-2 domain-containing protein n=1 Tax=Cimex lectularius TaxID=79782 RepID=A0A8I6TBP1_CIMLE|nr:uncharacterized protein LOC106662107 [Cimex lectularius]
MEIEAVLTSLFLITNTFAAPQSLDPQYDGFELVSSSVNLLGHYDSSYLEIESRMNDCSGTTRVKCYNETAVSLCTTGGQRIIPCQGLTPKCNPVLNVCVSGRVVLRAAEFTCPAQDGYYPDLMSCRKYYFCAKGKAKEYNCDVTDVYDPKTRSCVRHLGNQCYRFQCIGKQGRFTPYPGEPNIYAICSGNQPVELFRCPDGLGMNEREQNCKPLCEKEGLIKDQTSCQKYHECTRLLTGFRVRDGECPAGSWFNPTFGQCRMLEDEKDCPEAFYPEEDNNSTTPEFPETTEMTPKTTSTTETPEEEDSEGEIDETFEATRTKQRV